MARPKSTKQRAAERRAQRRQERKLPEWGSGDWVVCEKCGFVQPYRAEQGMVYPEPDVSPCLRGLLSGPGLDGQEIDLECDGQYCVTLDTWKERYATAA